MSRIFCVIDGMTDPAFRVEQYKSLSEMRLWGYSDNCGKAAPETLGCMLSLLKIPPKADIRGYIEALGAGIPIEKNDLILRGSFYSLDKSGCCKEPMEAPDCISDKRVEYHRLGSNQALFVLKGKADCLQKLICRSPAEIYKKNAALLAPTGCDEVRELFDALLTDKGCALLWGQSAAVQFPKFAIKAAAVCKKNVVKGLARATGITVFEPENATADTDTDLDEKVFLALKAAERFPFVLLHINGADEASHRKNGLEKRNFLQAVDEKVLSRLIASQHEIVVTSDHGSDFSTGDHTNAPQPVFWFKGKGAAADGGEAERDHLFDFGGR